MPILVSGDYDQVRSLLGSEVSASDLPDATISMDVYQGIAEDWATRQIPDVSVLSAEDAARLHRAAILYLAGLLATSLPDYILRRDGGITGTEERMQPVDRRKQRDDLLSQGETILRDIMVLLPFVSAPMPTIFRTARGCRGR